MSKDGIQYPLWTQLGLNQRPSGYEPFALPLSYVSNFT
jgi:hypothetical protein